MISSVLFSDTAINYRFDELPASANEDWFVAILFLQFVHRLDLILFSFSPNLRLPESAFLLRHVSSISPFHFFVPELTKLAILFSCHFAMPIIAICIGPK